MKKLLGIISFVMLMTLVACMQNNIQPTATTAETTPGIITETNITETMPNEAETTEANTTHTISTETEDVEITTESVQSSMAETTTIIEETTTVEETTEAIIETNTSTEAETVPVEPEPVVLPEIKVGDSVYFGTYEQDNDFDNGQEPIEWYILDEKDGKVFLFSKRILDIMKFDDKSSKWRTSQIRQWLNNDFYNIAFSETDKDAIAVTVTKNSDVRPYGEPGGADTEDKVFLLSLRDVKNYLGANRGRDGITWVCWDSEYRERWLACPTPYCVSKDIHIDDGYSAWFIRWLSEEEYPDSLSVSAIGYLDVIYSKLGEFFNEYVDHYEQGVRPALWVEKEAVSSIYLMAPEETEPLVVADDFVIDWESEIIEYVTRQVVEVYDRPLTYGDVKNITKLNLDNLQIDNIDDLAYFTSLEELSILGSGKKMFMDMRCLARLKKLTSLSISGSQVMDIGPLAYVTSLKHLELRNNDISCDHPLAYLTNLETLDISEYFRNIDAITNMKCLKNLTISGSTFINELEIADNWCGLETLSVSSFEMITGLEKLTNLQSLSINNIEGVKSFEDIKGLDKLTNLMELDIHGKEIESLDGIDVLSNLTSLNVSNTGISSLQNIKKITSLTSLNISSTNIKDLEGLENLINLTSFEAWSTGISDIDEIGSLVNLKNLYIRSTEVEDISAIGNLVNLETLDILYINVNDISVLENLTNLKILWMGKGILIDEPLQMDISVLANLKELVELKMGGIYNPDISWLAELTKLQVLYMYNNGISNIDTLSGLTNLKELSLEGNNIDNIDVLSGLTNLTILSLGNNNISNIDVLSELTNLTELYLDSNEISSINALSRLYKLSRLDLEDNKIKDVKALSDLKTLWYLDIKDNLIKDYTPVEFVGQLYK